MKTARKAEPERSHLCHLYPHFLTVRTELITMGTEIQMALIQEIVQHPARVNIISLTVMTMQTRMETDYFILMILIVQF